jgi:hypothetical protein
MSNEKTIRMPKKLLKRWLKALRSGTYTQTKRALYRPETCGFCCLGVLQHAVSGGYVETYDHEETFKHFPSMEWRAANDIKFFNRDGATSCDPWLPTKFMSAADMNDSGLTFAEIADAIELHAEGV